MKQTNNTNLWKRFGIFFLAFSLLPLSLGFHKMFAYKAGEYTWSDSVNAYVGGDAYNYIINSNYATGYFVLTGVLVLAAIGCGVMWNLYEIRKASAPTEEVQKSAMDILLNL